MADSFSRLNYLGFDKRHVKIALASIPAGAERPVDVRSLLEELRRLCAKWNLHFGLIWSQIMHETGDFSSLNWSKLHNPAGIKNGAGTKFMNYYNGVDAARAMMSHIDAYLPENGDRDHELRRIEFDPRWTIGRALSRQYARDEQATIARIARDWAEDPNYAALVSVKYARLFALDGVWKPVLIVAGHRNLSGGNPIEADRTDDVANAYLHALTTRGVRAEWWQQIDGDTDPDDTQGYLADVAVGCNDWLSRQPDGGILIDCHFEGGGSPGVFAIYPDWPGDANNTLDQRYGKAITQAIHDATGLPLRTSGVTSPGLMSERQSGVGSQGFRLGMFGLTVANRAKSVRLVIEHGSLDQEEDRAIIDRPGFYTLVANAAVGAILAVQR